MRSLVTLVKSSTLLYLTQNSLRRYAKMAKAGAEGNTSSDGSRRGHKFIAQSNGDPNFPISPVDYWHRYYGVSLPDLLSEYETAGGGSAGVRHLINLGLEEPDANHIAQQHKMWNSDEQNPEMRQPGLEFDTRAKRKQFIRSTQQRQRGEPGTPLPSGTAGPLAPNGEAARLALGNLADNYVASLGLDPLNHATLPGKTFDKRRATEMARVFELMKHDPNNPEVRRSYEDFIKQTKDQWDLIRKFIHPKTGKPIVFEPYHDTSDIKNYQEKPRKMLQDLHENGHLWYFPTSFGFGPGESHEDIEGSNNPLAVSIYPEGHPDAPPGHIGHFTANDMFRIVHDVMGHGLVGSPQPSAERGHEGTEPWKGYSFGAQGEEAAYQHHRKMYTPSARMAMSQELRGQNSWVNYGPYGQRNRARLNKDQGGTEYAPQKTGLWPEEFS